MLGCMKRILLLIVCLLMLPIAVAQTGYRIVHPDGTVEFTDDPTKGGEEVELREAPTFKAPPIKPASSASQQQSTADPGGAYRSIAILVPQQEQTIWFEGSGVSVSVQVVPALKAPHKVVIYLDNQEVASGSGSSFTLNEVDRGSHTLQAKIVDDQGQTLVSSDSVTFFMRYHSIKKPQKPQTP